MVATGVVEPTTDEHVLLMGRPPLGEYLGTLTSLASDPQDTRILADEWRAANDHIRELEEREAGLADRPAIEQLPREVEPLAQQVLNNPIFRRAFSIVPNSLGVVQLDRLVVYQKHINLEFVGALRAQLGENPSLERI